MHKCWRAAVARRARLRWSERVAHCYLGVETRMGLSGYDVQIFGKYLAVTSTAGEQVLVDAATGADVTAAQSELAWRIFGLRNLSGSVVAPGTVHVVALKVDRDDSRTYLTRFTRAELC